MNDAKSEAQPKSRQLRSEFRKNTGQIFANNEESAITRSLYDEAIANESAHTVLSDIFDYGTSSNQSIDTPKKD